MRVICDLESIEYGELCAPRYNTPSGGIFDGHRILNFTDSRQAAVTPESLAHWQVRTMRSWPRSWPNFSLLSLYSHINAWANMHILGPT